MIWSLALARNGKGQAQEAPALLRLAAPLDKPGYAPAHLMAARSLLAGTNLTTTVFKEAEVHLKHALKLEPNSADANELLGRVYFRMGDWDLAQKHLQAVVSTRPGVALMLATLGKRSGDDIGMKRWAERAAKHYRDKVNAADEDSMADRLAWAEALAMQENYGEAIQILDVGRKRSGSPLYSSAMASLYASWAEQVAWQEPRDVVSRLTRVQQGLECEPKNVRLLKLLIALGRMQGPEGNAARDSLTTLLADGGSSPMLHFILGSDAWQQGDQDQARKHFSLAFESAPDLPLVANHLALLLALGDQPDLPRALAIINPLAEKFPGEPHFRETRGQILVRLERWEEAVKDLEFALPRLRDRGATHTALAQAYRHLGMQRLQAEHERLAREAAKPKSTSRGQEPPARDLRAGLKVNAGRGP